VKFCRQTAASEFDQGHSTAEAVGRLAPLIYTVSLTSLHFSVVFTAPANCVEQRASQLSVIRGEIKNQTKRVYKIMSIKD
jgi:hypothetical protein